MEFVIHTFVRIALCHVECLSFLFFRCFISSRQNESEIEDESEVKIDNADGQRLIMDRQVNHPIFRKLYIYVYRSIRQAQPLLLSDPIFQVFFLLRIISVPRFLVDRQSQTILHVPPCRLIPVIHPSMTRFACLSPEPYMCVYAQPCLALCSDPFG